MQLLKIQGFWVNPEHIAMVVPRVEGVDDNEDPAMNSQVIMASGTPLKTRETADSVAQRVIYALSSAAWGCSQCGRACPSCSAGRR